MEWHNVDINNPKFAISCDINKDVVTLKDDMIYIDRVFDNINTIHTQACVYAEQHDLKLITPSGDITAFKPLIFPGMRHITLPVYIESPQLTGTYKIDSFKELQELQYWSNTAYTITFDITYRYLTNDDKELKYEIGCYNIYCRHNDLGADIHNILKDTLNLTTLLKSNTTLDEAFKQIQDNATKIKSILIAD